MIATADREHFIADIELDNHWAEFGGQQSVAAGDIFSQMFE
ncbi:hypothetical protein MI149_30260 [Mycolicibacterium crocinum]|uniref:Uncharacterized protein n=1 Tax=Mycolicibacterium crocinum TaxID=388459 RepID=A0ABY5TTC9_9MYCO|nr:hypothetical protein [Mycolicibacterium crocinum]UVY96049.1 hypothetical protein MI149_30260 [Mycolicibacterium crocinum]